MHFIKKMLLLHVMLVVLFCCNAQQPKKTFPTNDSLNLSIDSAQSIFLRNNYLLLAQKYNIDMAKGLVIQAKLYPNPGFNFATTIYNPIAKKVFPLAGDGEVITGISQLILLAGKRNKQIKIAQANVVLNEYQFFDLLRTLKYMLRTDFYNIYYLQHC